MRYNNGMQALTGKTRLAAALIVLALIAGFVFLPVVNADFVKSWDDASYVTANPMIQSLTPSDLVRAATAFLLGNYHPLTMMVFAVQYQFFGLNARGYHAVSVILHVVNCLLVFWLIYLVWGNIPAAFLSGLLFGLHPLRVETVAWISDQKDLLCAGFALLAIIGYINFRRRNRIAFYLLALLAFILSLLAKASALLLPVFLLITDYVRDRRIGRRMILDTLPFFGVSLILGAVSLAARGSYQGQLAEHVFSIGQKALIGVDRLVYYFLGRNFFPNIYPYLNTYDIARNGLPIAPTVIAFAILAVIVFGVILSLKRTKKIAWSFGFFAIFIFPAFFTVSLGYSADRFTYLPAVGVAFLGQVYFQWLYRRVYREARIIKYAIIGLVVGLVAVLAVMTRQAMTNWRDSVRLTDYFVKIYPEDPTAYLNRGLAYQDANEFPAAIADFSSALVINPGYAEAYNRRALVFYEIGDFERAIIDFSAAVRIDPNYAEVYYNRGNVFYDMKVFNEAEADYTRAIKFDSTRAELFYNRGNVRARLGGAEPAISDYSRAVALDPSHARAYYNRAISYLLLKNYKAAYRDIERSIDLGFKVNPALVDSLKQYANPEEK